MYDKIHYKLKKKKRKSAMLNKEMDQQAKKV